MVQNRSTDGLSGTEEEEEGERVLACSETYGAPPAAEPGCSTAPSTLYGGLNPYGEILIIDL